MKDLFPASDPVARRRRAEARLKARSVGTQPGNEADLRRLQHELEVHEIELEMQNGELVAAQAEVAAGLERYVDLFEFAPVGYFNLTADGTIQLVNLTGATLLGIERGRLVGARFGLWVAEADRPAFAASIEQVFSTGKKAVCEFTLVRAGLPARVGRFEAARSPGGTECRAVLMDITEQRALEEQLRHAQRMLAIGTMSAGVAHDINNTLTPVVLSANLLLGHITDPHDRELLDLILAAAERGSGLVKQLLTFTRGVSGRRVPVQPRRLIGEMMTLMQETFPRNLTFTAEIPADLRPVLADSTQLHQVLMNLCVNARDAMPNGGRLTLRAHNADLDEQDVVGHEPARPGPYCALVVSDTGEGIAPDNLERIFDPFFTTKAREKGTGLGLSVVAGIVRSHAGFVAVASAPGAGATFTVYLPSTVEPAPSGPAVVQPPPLGHGELILIVDDEPMISDTLKLTLEFAGYRAVTAQDGAAALALCVGRIGEVHLVLTDLMMPVMDGATFIHALRLNRQVMPAIIFTGLIESDTRARLAADGVHCILPKPCEVQKLLRAVARELAGRNSG